jgi:hypothetical protein
LAEAGVFVFEHLFEDWETGPYGRLAYPQKPRTLDQLKPSLRSALEKQRFEALDFRETTHVQPAEHVACRAPWPDFLRANFVTRGSL